MIDLNFKYKNLIMEIENQSPFTPELAIILGSGLGDFDTRIEKVNEIPTNSIKEYPASTVEGHKGKIIWGKHNGKKILLFSGRIHFYEGYHISQCILPPFISYKLGCKNILLTNAAGGISSFLKPGDLMLNTSFNGIQIKKELTVLLGIANPEKKNAFLNFPSEELNNLIRNAAKEEKIELKEGVYWFTKGPTYETPAEVRYISKFGGDAVGMSTVHEAVFSANVGMKAASISCITNYASGISQQKLSHDDVTETALKVKEKFAFLVKAFVNTI
jgi:purine-nucleoside phosphorylase